MDDVDAAMFLNSSSARCVGPAAPAEALESLPGLDLAKAIISATLLQRIAAHYSSMGCWRRW